MTNPSRTSLPPLNFILDFDGTIITEDTISVLANFALLAQAEKGQDLSTQWSTIVTKYSEEYTRYIQNSTPPSSRKTIDEEIAFQRGLNVVEERSFMRVSDSGVFRGMGREELVGVGRAVLEKGEVVVRSGFESFVKGVERVGGRCGVVSVNFSGDFINGVLGSILGNGKEVPVLANCVDAETGFLKGPGEGGVLATSGDKLRVMRELVRNRWKSDMERTVYVGDSGTDIECLLEAQVGIVVTDEEGKSKLLERMVYLGLDVKHIAMYKEKEEKCVYWTRGFREISQVSLLFGT